MRLPRPGRDRPWRAGEFEALSPIAFAEQARLVEKLRRLASTKSGGRGAPPRDRSQANTQYSVFGEGLNGEGVARGAFEHQR